MEKCVKTFLKTCEAEYDFLNYLNDFIVPQLVDLSHDSSVEQYSEIVEFHKKMEAMVIDRTWKKDERGFEKFEKLVNKSDPKSTSIPKKTMLFDNDIREQKMEYFKSELQDCNTRIYNCLQITPVNDQLLDELKEYRRELMTFMSHC